MEVKIVDDKEQFNMCEKVAKLIIVIVMVWMTTSNQTKGYFTLDRIFIFHCLSVSLT